MKNLQVLDAVETLSQASLASELSLKEQLPQPERIRRAFSVLSNYLEKLYQSDQMLLKNHDYLASLKAVMVIAEEAYGKLDLISKVFNTSKTDLGENEFSTLFDFYLKKINYKVEHVAGEVFRHQEEERLKLEKQTHGLKNLENIRKDYEYELFYIKDEDGMNHFSRNLLRHTELLGTFDEIFLSFSGEDPFVFLKYVDDRMIQHKARYLKKELSSRTDYFIKEAFRFKKHPFIAYVSQMTMALFLSSYQGLVLQNGPEKACFEYFSDFMMYLDHVTSKPEFYRSPSTMELVQDKGIFAAQRYASSVIKALFFAKNENQFFADHLYRFVNPPKMESFAPLSFFAIFLEFDTGLRSYLSNFPSGPLMKALDFVKEVKKPNIFAPLRNLLPQFLFDLKHNENQVSCVAMGSPTQQQDISIAETEVMFEVCLKQFGEAKTILFDLEDPQDMYAKARLSAVKNLENDQVFFVNFPRNGTFYQQGDVYATLHEAKGFISLFSDFFDMEEDSPYKNAYFTKKEAFKMMNFVHKELFESKDILNFKERLDFIELTHLFMAIKLVELINPENLFVICKDGLDHSNAFSCALYALIKLLNHENLANKSEFDFLLGQLYGPAMIKRDRPIFIESITRFGSALAHFQHAMMKHPVIADKFKVEFPRFKFLKAER